MTENLAIFRMLDDHTGTPWPKISSICAVVKFGIIFEALAFIAAALAWAARTRWRRPGALSNEG